MKKMKIVIVGNCQARPIAKIMSKLNGNIDVTNVAIVHLLNDELFHQFENDFEEADYIITQLVADNYPCKFVRTSNLKRKYGAKVYSIVNLYFSGYTPDWVYIRNPGKGTLKGPMSDYHNLTIVKAWLDKLSGDDAVLLVEDREYNKENYSHLALSSLDELKQREMTADVKIADFIESQMNAQRLFFTFNHPCMFLIIEYCCRLLTTLNISYDKHNATDLGEMLNQFIPNLNSGLNFNFPSEKIIKGVEVVSIAIDELKTGAKREYSLREIIEVFYQVYDMNASLIVEKFSK
ncbi:WcbI family polysaccharide biosynthesis putative acetyltransferase [Shewanella benthica]|uniref:WcbI family polysaccharide biosynthesis putative acetyltransferase n=1 Tax=Shewanella benthica TaxID=43661 RepID=UPI0018799397|nr:WcbI family polysaccharide biosynthesis putative acetyltransferase [Shewanella benthica]MBE7213921.1 hypothetical protein [Shewanella benthica]MCL1061827.1 WcbI family polysaccharide biosynthesis putative acetyltransferase [Shewanella benthica]